MFFDNLTIAGIVVIVCYVILVYVLSGISIGDLLKRALKANRLLHS
jgi:hypothetical protein